MKGSDLHRAQAVLALFLAFGAACSDETRAPGAGAAGSTGAGGTSQSPGSGGTGASGDASGSGGTAANGDMTDAASVGDGSGSGGMAGQGGAADAGGMPATTFKATWASVDTHPPAPEWFQDAKF